MRLLTALFEILGAVIGGFVELLIAAHETIGSWIEGHGKHKKSLDGSNAREPTE